MKVTDKLTGRVLDSSLVEFVDRIIPMSNKRSPWVVIEEMISFWASKNPEQYKSYVVTVKEKRETRADKFGASKRSGQRYMLDIPQDLLMMIQVVYPDQELNKEFFREFAKRFPQFSVAEKI